MSRWKTTCVVLLIAILQSQVIPSSLARHTAQWEWESLSAPAFETGQISTNIGKGTPRKSVIPILNALSSNQELTAGELRARFKIHILQNMDNYMRTPLNRDFFKSQANELGTKTNKESIIENFVRDRIREYYKLRTGEAKKQWMYKPSKGTTRHLREIFLGRCWDFVRKKDSGLEDSDNVSCDVLWNCFVKTFSYKGPCNATWNDYKSFFDLYQEGPIYNKVLLWSGTREWAHAYTSLFKRYVTLEDTLPGYLLNGLTWCGSSDWPGINYEACPYECSKQTPFWGQAAEKLAKRSRGTVHILLNGTRQHLVDKQIFPAFMDDSYLAENQLPNLPVEDIDELKILVGHSLHHTKLESCNSLSVKELQDRATARGLKTMCYDDPFVIRHLLCTDQPLDSLCLFKTMSQDER